MCGIAGILNLSSSANVDLQHRIKIMSSLLSHRGPDSEGFFFDDSRLAIYNNRLAIVGINDDIKLPLRKLSDRYVIAYNGEIYNQKKLRQYLINQGASFDTHTDTEILMNGLIGEGLQFLNKINGMWAFAFIDRLSQKVYLSRDLLGEKPLYYYKTSTEVIFCSEIQPILAVMSEAPSWDLSSITSSMRYRAAPSGKTLIQGVSRLRGGEALEVNLASGVVTSLFPRKIDQNKWKCFFDKRPGRGDVISLYEQEIERACNERLPSEVSFTATLSGGIDSTLVNLMLSEFGQKKISAIHGHSAEVSFEKKGDMSESDAARFTANMLNIDLTEFQLYDNESLAVHEKVASDSFDGVLCEGVAAFRLLAKMARSQGNKVLVLSDGADELQSGYISDIQLFRSINRLNRLSEKSKKDLYCLINRRKSWFKKSQRLLNWASYTNDVQRFRPNHAGTSPDLVRRIFSNEFINNDAASYGLMRSPVFNEDVLCSELDIAQKSSIAYVATSLPDYVNTKSDRATMGESIEARLPFLDVALVELFLSTPLHYRLDNNLNGKAILRGIVEKYVGKKVSTRGKYGFAQPIWKKDEFRQKLGIRDVIMSSGFFKDSALFSNGAREFFGEENGRLSWMAYCLAMSHENLQSIRKKYRS